jgi:hypothetical protein
MRSPCCLCFPPYQLLIGGTNFYETLCIMASEPISTAYFINPSHYVSMCISPTVARQRLGENVTAATNTHATIVLLDVSSSVWSVSYEGEWAISSSQDLVFVVPFYPSHPVWRRGQIPPP